MMLAGKQRQSGQQVEDAERGAAQLRWRLVGDEGGQEALREAHVKSREADADHDTHYSRRECQHQVGDDEEKETN
jgi:hypothetical protein